MTTHSDLLVIGSGIAGMTVALDAADHAHVRVIAKRGLGDTNTRFAQGGVAAVLSESDSFETHARDTLVAGAGLCHKDVVHGCVREGPARIRDLLARGVAFDRDGSVLSLTREGGHSERRVAHCADATGDHVQTALLAALRAHPNIELLEYHTAIDLILVTPLGGPDRCVGAYVLDEGSSTPDKHVILSFLARETVLATGGAGKVYLYSSNPDVATGDGVAMAYRAGAEIGNMEFYQFHPTCLYHPKAKSFLVSEALRGEGAVLRLPDENGTPFMRQHDERGDLAPRDIVARAIDFEMKRAGYDYVHLDITHKSADFISEHFPTIYARCKGWGIDIRSDPIPIVPAAHYMCGGVTTDASGRTTVPGLTAIGEAAFTGLHGANRLASNSLLEGMVFGHRAAHRMADSLGALKGDAWPDVPDWKTGKAVVSDEEVVVAHNWDELRRTMWNYVGIVRTHTRLRRAARRIALLQDEIREYYWRHLVTRDLLELRNIATVAELIVASAAARPESRGLHYMLDHPKSDDQLIADTVIKRGVPAHLRGLRAGHVDA